MKTASTTFLVTLLLLTTVVAPPARAQNDALPGARTNPVTTAVPSEPVATDGADDNPPPQIRIDDTGVHIGGPSPVDINVPAHGRKDGGLPAFLALMLPIISVLAVFGMPVAIVGFILYFKHRRNRMLHDTLRTMVEKGVPIPPELFSGGGPALAGAAHVTDRGNKDLRAGLILIAVGGGLYFIAGKFGLIPIFIGVALITVWLISGRNKGRPTPQ